MSGIEWDTADGPRMIDPVADILAALARSKAEAPQAEPPRHMIVAPGMMRRWIWLQAVVRPRIERGEYVGADEWNPPITAEELRARLGR